MEVTHLLLPSDLELHTPVLHLAEVGHRGALAHVGRNRLIHQHAVGVLDIVVYAEGQAAVEETGVETEIVLLGLLPANGGVGESARGLAVLHRSAAVGTEIVILVAVHQGRVTEVTDVLVTVLAPAGAELELVDPARTVVLEPRLVGDVPTQRSGREGGPLVARAEAGRTVAADRELEHVALVVVVVETEEIGGQALVVVAAGAAVHLLIRARTDGGIDVGLGRIGLEQLVVAAGNITIRIAHSGLAEHGADAVLAKLLAVGEIILRLPAEAAVHRAAHVALLEDAHRTAVVREAVPVAAPEAQVHAVAGLELETGEDIQLGTEVGDEFIRIALAVGVGVQLGQRVGQLLETGRRHGEYASVLVHDGGRMGSEDRCSGGVVGIDGNRRVEADGGTQDGTILGVGLDARGNNAGVCDIGGERQFIEEIARVRLIRDVAVVGTESQALIVGLAIIAADDTVLLEIAQGNEIGGLLGAAAHGQLMLRDGRVEIEGLRLPVGALAGSRNLSCGIHRGAAVVDAGLVHDHHVLGGVEHFLLSPRVLPSIAAIIGNGGLALLAAARGHENYTVGRAGTVDSRGSGVFQDFHGSDVGRVQIVDASVNRHAVHDVERIGIVDGADAADLDLGTGTRLAGGLRDLYAGDLALEGVVDRRCAHRVEGFAVHFGDGCGHDALLLDTVADDHGLFQHLGVILKDDAEFAGRRSGHVLAPVADAGHFQGSTLRRAEGESSVHVGHGAVGRAALHYKSADNRLPCRVHDDSFDGDALGQGCQAQS